MSAEPVFTKDSDETLDYQIDWSSWLGTDTISTSTWVVDSGITKVSDTNTTTTTVIWLSGGSDGTDVSSTNGFALAASEEVFVAVDNIATVYLDVSVSGEGATYIAS